MDRLKKVNNTKKARLAAAHPSVKSHFSFANDPSAVSSSSSASASTTRSALVALSLWSGAGPRTLELLLVDGCCKRRARKARVGGIDLC